MSRKIDMYDLITWIFLYLQIGLVIKAFDYCCYYFTMHLWNVDLSFEIELYILFIFVILFFKNKRRLLKNG